ncbi:MAG TPA: amidophosphoribosyltransferase [Smithella sp.]|jgi:ComF family protein|nr:amidophosphoribosyltransferase [Smithella sp.]
MTLHEALNDLNQVIFPPRCLGCAEILHPFTGKIFCSVCNDKIKFINGSICSICGTTFSDSPAENHLCGECLEKRPYFSYARAVFSYETIILHAIHQFKYGNNISVGALLASFMADFSFPDIDFTDYSLIMPVPLHIKRLRERGFNQSLILTRTLGKKQQIPVNYSLLRRHKFTETQTGMHKAERKQNIKRAFEVSSKEKIAGKNIILVDDVYTTGATVNECAKTLIKAGAQKVTVLTLARVLQN